MPSLEARGPQLLVGTGRAGVVATIDVRLPTGIDAVWVPSGATAATLQFTAVQGAELVLACTLGGAPVISGRSTAQATHESAPPRWLVIPPETQAGLGRITAGAVRYTLHCTTLDGGGGTAVILTDHRILPLSWTR